MHHRKLHVDLRRCYRHNVVDWTEKADCSQGMQAVWYGFRLLKSQSTESGTLRRRAAASQAGTHMPAGRAACGPS